jgi:hypothetical protein
MKELLHDSEIGEIMYEESIWTGKKTIYINGKPLEKISKTMFVMDDNGEQSYVMLKGNIYTGLSLEIKGRDIVVSDKPKWYELTLAILTFALCLIWGNSTALCSIIPIVGGGIGGAISGALAITSLLVMKKSNEVWKKLLIGIGMLVGAFFACFIIGMLILLILI